MFDGDKDTVSYTESNKQIFLSTTIKQIYTTTTMNVSNGTSFTMSTFYFYCALFATIVFLSGLLLNILIIYIFLIDKYFAQTMYRLMLISAFSDIIAVINQLIMYFPNLLGDLHPDQSPIMCKLNFAMSFMSYMVSVYNFCLIAIDRYLIILHPHNRFYNNNKNRIIVVSEITIWLAANLMAIPFFHFLDTHPQEPTLCDAVHMDYSMSVYGILLTTCMYIMPSIVIVLIYSRIIRYQNSYIRPCLATNEEEDLQRMKTQKITKKLLNITLGYLISTWPSFMAILIMSIEQKSLIDLRQQKIGLFILVSFLLIGSFSITIATPLLYLKFDENIRTRVWKLVKPRNGVSKIRCPTSCAVNVRKR